MTLIAKRITYFKDFVMFQIPLIHTSDENSNSCNPYTITYSNDDHNDMITITIKNNNKKQTRTQNKTKQTKTHTKTQENKERKESFGTAARSALVKPKRTERDTRSPPQRLGRQGIPHVHCHARTHAFMHISI